MVNLRSHDHEGPREHQQASNGTDGSPKMALDLRSVLDSRSDGPWIFDLRSIRGPRSSRTQRKCHELRPSKETAKRKHTVTKLGPEMGEAEEMGSELEEEEEGDQSVDGAPIKSHGDGVCKKRKEWLPRQRSKAVLRAWPTLWPRALV